MMSKDFQASTSDIIVDSKEGILLIKRGNKPFKNRWALPGGFLITGKETLEETAKRELKEETGLIVSKKNLKLFGVYSDPKRDPRGQIISHTYIAKKTKGRLKHDSEVLEIKFFKRMPNKLAADHKKILKDYLKSIS